jgi:hypothetical protein
MRTRYLVGLAVLALLPLAGCIGDDPADERDAAAPAAASNASGGGWTWHNVTLEDHVGPLALHATLAADEAECRLDLDALGSSGGTNFHFWKAVNGTPQSAIVFENAYAYAEGENLRPEENTFVDTAWGYNLPTDFRVDGTGSLTLVMVQLDPDPWLFEPVSEDFPTPGYAMDLALGCSQDVELDLEVATDEVFGFTAANLDEEGAGFFDSSVGVYGNAGSTWTAETSAEHTRAMVRPYLPTAASAGELSLTTPDGTYERSLVRTAQDDPLVDPIEAEDGPGTYELELTRAEFGADRVLGNDLLYGFVVGFEPVDGGLEDLGEHLS